jgi:hypothetical protein
MNNRYAHVLEVALADYQSKISGGTFEAIVAAAKEQWDASNPALRQTYRNVFNAYGTHVVVGCSYGTQSHLVSNIFSYCYVLSKIHNQKFKL